MQKIILRVAVLALLSQPLWAYGTTFSLWSDPIGATCNPLPPNQGESMLLFFVGVFDQDVTQVESVQFRLEGVPSQWIVLVQPIPGVQISGDLTSESGITIQFSPCLEISNRFAPLSTFTLVALNSVGQARLDIVGVAGSSGPLVKECSAALAQAAVGESLPFDGVCDPVAVENTTWGSLKKRFR